MTRCLKITEKVSFNSASEASYSYVYILSGQKWSILASFLKPEASGQTVYQTGQLEIGQKLVENAKIEKFNCDILGDFQTLCPKLDHSTRVTKQQKQKSIVSAFFA